MRKELRELVRPTRRRLWMSEFGCGSFPISSMETALELSSIILKVCICAQITLSIARYKR